MKPRKAPARPLSAKGVLSRWGLPDGERYVGVPDAVFRACMIAGANATDWLVLSAVLLRWNWRSGTRQIVSVRQIALALGHKGRTTVSRSLRRLQTLGLVLVDDGTEGGSPVTYLDMAPLRSKAAAVAAGRLCVDAIPDREPRNGRVFGGQVDTPADPDDAPEEPPSDGFRDFDAEGSDGASDAPEEGGGGLHHYRTAPCTTTVPPPAPQPYSPLHHYRATTRVFQSTRMDPDGSADEVGPSRKAEDPGQRERDFEARRTASLRALDAMRAEEEAAKAGTPPAGGT